MAQNQILLYSSMIGLKGYVLLYKYYLLLQICRCAAIVVSVLGLSAAVMGLIPALTAKRWQIQSCDQRTTMRCWFGMFSFETLVKTLTNSWSKSSEWDAHVSSKAAKLQGNQVQFQISLQLIV